MTTLRVNARTTWDGLRWAWWFYWRHFPLVAGISLIPATQRLVSQLWKAELAGPAAVGLEIVTAVARVGLLALVIWLGIARDPELRQVSAQDKQARFGSFVRHRWLSVVISLVVLLGLGVVFDVIPESLISSRIPEAEQAPYWGVLLAVKNPTIIAFTLVWMVAIARESLRFPSPADATTSRDTATGEPRQSPGAP